jgi:hypothetical protein
MYAQSDLATLVIQIASVDDFSVLEVLGTAELGGTLEPVLLNGFTPTVGQTFDFLFYDDHFGEFDRIANQNFGNLQWVITDSHYGDRMATLRGGIARGTDP